MENYGYLKYTDVFPIAMTDARNLTVMLGTVKQDARQSKYS